MIGAVMRAIEGCVTGGGPTTVEPPTVGPGGGTLTAGAVPGLPHVNPDDEPVGASTVTIGAGGTVVASGADSA